MKRALALLVASALAVAAAPAAAEEAGRYGRLSLGPRVGGGIAPASGPRGGYYAGLELTYSTPRYFYYDFEVGFLHLLPTTVGVDRTTSPSSDGTSTLQVAPAHDVDVTGLYGVPLTMEVGVRLPLGPVALRAGVGFGAMFSVQTLEAFDAEETEFVASFCFRPELGVDLETGPGELRFDLFYLWQDADWDGTGGDHDVDSLMLTVGYAWGLTG